MSLRIVSSISASLDETPGRLIDCCGAPWPGMNLGGARIIGIGPRAGGKGGLPPGGNPGLAGGALAPAVRLYNANFNLLRISIPTMINTIKIAKIIIQRVQFVPVSSVVDLDLQQRSLVSSHVSGIWSSLSLQEA